MHWHKKPSFSRVRVIHNVAQGPNVNVVVDGTVALQGVGYKAVSDYLRLPSGKHVAAITTTDGAKTLASVTVDLAPNADYTVIAHGNVADLSSIALLALKDDNSCPAAGKSHVRFVHAAAGAPAVDIWAGGSSKVFTNVSYGSTGTPVYLPVSSGSIKLSVTPSGTTNVVLGPLHLNLEPLKTYTLVATGIVGDNNTPLSVIVSEDNLCSTVHTHHHRW